MSKLLLTYYGDDFTGSTDALEQLTLAGIRTMLFIVPPTPAQLKRFPGLQAIGAAGHSRSLSPEAMEKELRRAFGRLKRLGARHIHYKVCSTFDSSPTVGSIGRAIDIGARIIPGRFVPVLTAAPALGRYTVFGQHFARYGIGSAGLIHRLDRHPSISRHPVTPMTEADLRLHLAKQTSKSIGLFDILTHALPLEGAHRALEKLIAEKHKVILFDALSPDHVTRVGELLERYADDRRPFFSVGSSGIETALASQFITRSSRGNEAQTLVPPAGQILVGSGSCSPVTSGQIDWALRHGFAEVAIDTRALIDYKRSHSEIVRVIGKTVDWLRSGHSVIVHTTKTGADKRLASKLSGESANMLGVKLGMILYSALVEHPVRRICIAGGDTSSYAARGMMIEALEMIAPLTPGAPLCRAHSKKWSWSHGREFVFKGGQVGPENYFEIVLKGKS